LSYNYEDYDQFIKRVHRQGQQNSVIVHRILAKDTLDEAVAAALSRKEGTQQMLFEAIKEYWGG
jgi:hypothetical protein